MKIIDLLGITVAPIAGLCGAALAFSPDAAAAPLPTGGGACLQQSSAFAAPIEQMSGAAAPAAAGLPAGSPACIAQMSGLAAPLVPAVLPGPPVVPAAAPVPLGAPPVPVPLGPPPVPLGAPPVPLGAPLAAGAAGVPDGVAPGAPLVLQSGTGKGVPTTPAPGRTADPVVLPGPPTP